MTTTDINLWQKVCLVGLGGAAGAMARYGLTMGAKRFAGLELPWGIFAVNALGCLGFGIVATILTKRTAHAELFSVLILIGFMGSFTTFSTFASQTVDLLETRRWLGASINLIGQNIVGLLFVFLGARLGLWLAGTGAGA